MSRVAQESVQRLEDIVNRAIVQIALVVSQELDVPQKVLAVDLVEVAQVLLRREVKEESEAVVVRSQRLLTLALLVFALEELKLGEPLIHCVCDLCSTTIVLVLNDWHVCVESVEVCLLAFAGGDRLIEIVADVLPRTGAVSKRVPQEIGTGEIGGAAPTTEIDLLIAPSLCLCRPGDRV